MAGIVFNLASLDAAPYVLDTTALDAPQSGTPAAEPIVTNDGWFPDIDPATERVLMQPNPGGGLVATHLAEPSFVDEFDGVGRPPLLRLLLGDDVVAQHRD